MSKVNIFHGRTNKDGSPWEVIDGFDNTNNFNSNVNKLPALHTSNIAVAKEFAKKRSLIHGGSPETHQILSTDKYAVFLDEKKLKEFRKSDADKDTFETIQTLFLTLDFPLRTKDFAKVQFKEGPLFNKIFGIYEDLRKTLLGTNKGFSENLLSDAKKDNDLNEQEYSLLNSLAKGWNTRGYIGGGYLDNIVNSFLFWGKEFNGEYPISSEYISSFLAKNHICGVKTSINSATLNQNIEDYLLFDLKKINTEKVIGDKLNRAISLYSSLAENLLTLIDNKEVLNKFATSPHKIMEYFEQKAPDKLKKQFDSTIGLWEGFTLKQHTETVLNFFNDNFVKTTPLNEGIVPFLNLSILCHDIGKVEEQQIKKALNRNLTQTEKGNLYNKKTKELLESFGISKDNIEPLSYFITRLTISSQKYTTAYYVDKNPESLKELDNCSQKTLEIADRNSKNIPSLAEKIDFEPSTKNIQAFSSLARIIQTCDSGAYTLYAQTRDDENKCYYSNANVRFSNNLEKTRYGYRFKEDVEDTTNEPVL